MRSKIVLCALWLAAGLVPAPRAEAQVDGSAHLTTAVRTEEGEMRRRIGIAERHMERGNLSRARREYSALAEELIAQNVLPSEVMWRLAGVYFAERRPLEAAATLDELAVRAAEHGNAGVEVLSLLESSKVYERMGRTAESTERLKQAMSLLDSANLAEETRIALLKRMR